MPPGAYSWFTFDGAIIHGKSGKDWIPCVHLLPFLSGLLRKGATIDAVDEGWSKVDFVMNLSEGYTPELMKATVRQVSLEFGVNDDPHYPLDCELVCRLCRQGLSWPTVRARLTAL